MTAFVTPKANDAGAWSLLGYLYQLLGAASIRVSLEDGAAENGDVGAVIVEEHGQDAVVLQADTVRLIQFKHSQSAREISPSELADLLLTLEQSEASLAQKPPNVEWVLQTNRSLSAKSAALLQGKLRRGKGKITQATVRAIQRLGGRLTITAHSMRDFEGHLHDRARQFGVDDMARATNTVVGLLHQTVAKPPGQRQLILQDLDDALAGYAGARSIRASECAASLRQQLLTMAKDQGGIELAEAVPRPSVEHLLRRDYTALAVVTGPGGSGKTLSLLKGLHDLPNDQPRLVGALMPPPNPSSRTLQQLVASWRSSNGTPVESMDAALRRIIVANHGGPRPVLLLGLDGLDESKWRDRDDVQVLLLHFFELHQQPVQPDALLVVTCRTRQQFDDLLGPQGTGGRPPQAIPEVRLAEFTVEEFRTVWARWFPEDATPSVEVAADDSYTTLDQSGDTVGSNVARSLLHPVLLGCLRHWSSEERAQLIAGDQARWQHLLEQYVSWFSIKVTRRHACEANFVRAILRAAAIATENTAASTTFDMQTHWIKPGIDDTGEPRALVKSVFEDAVTAGMVDSEARFEMPARAPVAWKWHFAFVPEHLRTMP